MRAQGIRSLVAAVSSVLAVGLIVAAGMQPGELSAVPVAPVEQPLSPMSVSSAQPDLPPLSDSVRASADDAADEGAPLVSGVPMPSARVTLQEPEEAPGEDSTVLVKPSSVPTVPVPAVASSNSGALLSMPIQGRKTSRFGMRFHPVRHVWKLHSGLDLAAPCGTPVGAAAPGTVVRTGWAGGNGYQVKVEHGKLGGRNVVTTYNHLSAIGVQVGQKVETHQGLGRVGTTGFSTGCHLHFEVIADGQFTNPEPWLSGGAVVVDTLGMGAGRPDVPGSAKPSSTAPTTSPASPSPTPTPSVAPPSPSPTPSVSPSVPASSAPASPSATPTVTPSAIPTVVPSVTPPVTTPTPCVPPSATPEGAPNPCASVTPTPSGDTTPTPSGATTPTPSGATTPTPDEATTPTPDEGTTPTPTKDVTPTPTKDVTPTPTKVAPTETKVASPTPTKLTPTPTKDADAAPSSTTPSASEGESTTDA